MAVPPTCRMAEAARKAALRHILRQARRAHLLTLTRAEAEAQQAALAALLAPLLADAAVVASYAAVGAECDPAAADPPGAVIAFPLISPDRTAISFRAAARHTLVPGFGGIPAPPADAPEVSPDVLLVPLLAATPAGDRLGQGAGYYDRALASLRAAGPIVAVGIAWPVQVVADLPIDPWDARLDWLATPAGLLRCDAAAVG